MYNIPYFLHLYIMHVFIPTYSTRSPIQLLKYTVEFMRDLKRDMDRGEVQSQLNTGARKR